MPNVSLMIELVLDDMETLQTKIGGREGDDRWGDAAMAAEMDEYLFQEVMRLRDRLAGLLEQLRSEVATVAELASGGLERTALGDLQGVLSLLEGHLQWLDEQFDALDARLSPDIAATADAQKGAITRVRGWVKSLLSWLRRIGRQIWQLLSSMMTPKEWKLSGKVGTGPFNLADVGIEITFGK